MATQTPLVRWSRIGAMVSAWLFAAGIVIQVFLAGLALFDTALRWDDHSSFGYMIGIFPLITIVLVLVGRLPAPIIGMTVVMVVLYVVQTALPNLEFDYVAALHPIVAVALMGMSEQVGSRIRAVTANTSGAADARTQDAPVGASLQQE